jgi:plasmid maintenance system antidote protein VapI|nr:MAG TPA: LAMBDA REPRESSOR (TRIPLE MUTANT)/DNA COMPLEX-DNA COMPLEX, DOUBLE HELIX, TRANSCRIPTION-DNA.1A [Caudoviricetes sp.]
MRERGLTIRETAQAAHVSESTVTAFIYNKRKPNLTEKAIRGLCSAVGMRPRDWFE